MVLSTICVVVFVIQFETISSGTNQFNTSESTSFSYSTSGLFGYDIAMQKIGEETSVIVGVPPSSPETGHGNLQKCLVSPSNTSNITMRLECSSVPTPIAASIDNMGQSLSTNLKTGELLACSTTSTQICTKTVTLPGYCYVYDTTSTSSDWKSLDHEKTRGCPVSSTVDVLFILDGSSSVGRSNFEKIKRWTKAVTDMLDVDEGIAKVAVLQFGRWVIKEISFNTYMKLSSLQEALLGISYQDGGTPTVDALNIGRDVLKGSDRFGKEENAQVMIILTDGGSSQYGVLTAANNVRNIGAVTYAVGVGSGIDRNELRQLATGTTSNDRVYEVDDFDNLDSIVGSLQQQIETFIPTEGAGNLTVELAQVGIGMAFTKNKAVTDFWLGGCVCRVNAFE